MQMYAWQKNKCTLVISQLGFSVIYKAGVWREKKHLIIPRDNVVQMIDSGFLFIFYVVQNTVNKQWVN